MPGDLSEMIPVKEKIIKLGATEIKSLSILTEVQKRDIATVLGSKYVKGGETVKQGFDCSGLVYWLCLADPNNREIPRNRPSAKAIYNSNPKAKFVGECKNLNYSNLNYPVALSYADSKGANDHVVMLYGVIEIGGKNHYLIVQAGRYGRVGNRDSTVSALLVREDQFLTTFSNFRIFDPIKDKKRIIANEQTGQTFAQKIA